MREYDTTGLHPVEVGEIPTSSTNFIYPVAQQKQERFPAKEEDASAILAGIATLKMC